MPAKKTTKVKPAARNAAKPKTVVKKSVKPEATVTKSKLRATKATKTTPPSKSAVKPKPVIKKAAKLERTDVFVSYCHADKEWLSRLQVHLKPLERDHKINIWADTKLRGGDKWRDEIDKALAKAKVAILLVSADFMASDFIAKNELPPLLKATEKEGVLILSVIIGHSGGFAISSMSQFQAMNNPSLPLENMLKGQSEQVFAQLFKRVYDAFVQPIPKPIQRVKLETIDPPSRSKRSTSKQPTASIISIPVKKITSRSKAETKALLVKQNGDWEVVTIIQSELASDLALVIKASTAKQRAYLTSLRQSDQLSGVVLGFQTYVCKNATVQIKTEGIQETWHIKADLQQQNRRAQVTFSSITPDMQAESRARLLLLNEPISNDQIYYRHMNMVIDYEHSPFPTLYQHFNKKPDSFKQAASLIATLLLQINNIVEHIHMLTFRLKADKLTIRFEGERNSQYHNEASAIIKVEGTCDLSKPSNGTSLRLGPLSRY